MGIPQEQGYMPMIGCPAETGVVIYDEFREGNIAPASRNLEFIKDCETRLPKGHRIAHVRLDSAGYQANIFNDCEETNKTFAIGGRLDEPTPKAIEAIPESDWKHYADCAIAEITRSMNDTHKAFRLIVVKYKRQAELFDDKPKYHIVASNRIESAETTLIWYRQRGEVSENGIKELKIGFGMERMPCGQFEANAAFFRIDVIAHNLFVLFRYSAPGGNWQHHRLEQYAGDCFICQEKECVTPVRWCSRSPPNSSSCFETSVLKAVSWHNRSLPG